MDVIYMVMQPAWLPQVTQWTSLTVDSMTVLQHPNAMYSHRHTHTHTTHSCTFPQQGGMFQLADAERCSTAFVLLGLKVECIVLCQAGSALVSLVENKNKNKKMFLDRSEKGPPEADAGIIWEVFCQNSWPASFVFLQHTVAYYTTVCMQMYPRAFVVRLAVKAVDSGLHLFDLYNVPFCLIPWEHCVVHLQFSILSTIFALHLGEYRLLYLYRF